jgi:hypothetical protein
LALNASRGGAAPAEAFENDLNWEAYLHGAE